MSAASRRTLWSFDRRHYRSQTNRPGQADAALDERIAPGGRWAYRARAIDQFAEVEVVRFGTKAPLRVLVRFVDPDFEDRQEWVPARLKVPWEERGEFLKREQRWAAARSVASLLATPTDWAIGIVFGALPDWNYAEPEYNDDTGILSIRNLDGLLADLDWSTR